jgi:predicted secreted protein
MPRAAPAPVREDLPRALSRRWMLGTPLLALAALPPARAQSSELAIFNEKNPQRDVARFLLTPASGRAQVSTRIRLATTQQLVALARFSDGSIGQHRVEVLVTLAACIEG